MSKISLYDKIQHIVIEAKLALLSFNPYIVEMSRSVGQKCCGSLKYKNYGGGKAKRDFLVQVFPILVSTEKILFTMNFTLSFFHVNTYFVFFYSLITTTPVRRAMRDSDMSAVPLNPG